MYRIRQEGMGAISYLPMQSQDAPATPFGIHDPATSSYDCTDAVKWMFNAKCWPYSPSAWRAMAQFQQPPASVIVPPPAVGGTLSTLPGGPYACADGSTATAATNCPEYTAAVDAAIAQGKAATDQALLDWYKAQPPVGPTNCPDAVMNPDGTWTCPSSTPWLLYAGLAFGGLFVLQLAGRGRR